MNLLERKADQRVRDRLEFWMAALFYVIMFQNLVVSMLARMSVFTFQILQLLIVSKEIILLGLLLYLLIKKKERSKLNWFDILIWLNIGISIIFFFVIRVDWDVPLFARILDLRGFIIIGMAYYFGRFASEFTTFQVFFKKIRIGLILLVVFGIFEWSFINRDYLISGYTEFMKLKGGDAGIEGDESFAYYATFGSIQIVRMMSALMSPLSLAYFLVVPISFLSASLFTGNKSNINVILAIGVGSAIILSVTRAVIVGFCFALILYALFSTNKIKTLLFVVMFIFLMNLFLPFDKIITDTINLDDASSRGHQLGYLLSFESFIQNPWGHGLATAGPIANFSVEGQSMGGETLYLTIANTRGIFGLIAFILIPISVLFTYKKIINYEMRIAVFLSTITYVLASITTEVWIGFQTGAMYWMLLGFAYGSNNNNVHKIEKEL